LKTERLDLVLDLFESFVFRASISHCAVIIVEAEKVGTIATHARVILLKK